MSGLRTGHDADGAGSGRPDETASSKGVLRVRHRITPACWRLSIERVFEDLPDAPVVYRGFNTPAMNYRDEAGSALVCCVAKRACVPLREQPCRVQATGDGQTALVTGASAGIGVDLAECFAQDGYDVILAARTESALARGRRSAREHLPDQRDTDRRRPGRHRRRSAAGRRNREAGGCRSTSLVNNAGYGHAGAFNGSDAATQLGMIDLNDRALVELTHIYWPAMLANRRGGVLNVASTAAFQPGPLMAIYYASKAFVLSFSEALWEEARGTGVKVSCLCPGPTVEQVSRARRHGQDAAQPDRHADAVDDRRAHGIRRVAGEHDGSWLPACATASWRHSCGSCHARLVLRTVRNLQSPL